MPKPIGLTKPCEVIFGGSSLPVSQQEVKWYIRTAVTLFMWINKFSRKSNKPAVKAFEEKQGDDSTSYHPFIINEEQSIKLIQFCKSVKASVHSVLSVIFSSAIEETQKLYDKNPNKVQQIMFPVDARKFNNELSTSPMPCGHFFELEN